MDQSSQSVYTSRRNTATWKRRSANWTPTDRPKPTTTIWTTNSSPRSRMWCGRPRTWAALRKRAAKLTTARATAKMPLPLTTSTACTCRGWWRTTDANWRSRLSSDAATWTPRIKSIHSRPKCSSLAAGKTNCTASIIWDRQRAEMGNWAIGNWKLIESTTITNYIW